MLKQKSVRLNNCSTPLHYASWCALNTLKRGLTFSYIHSPHCPFFFKTKNHTSLSQLKRRIFADGNRRKYAALCPVHFLALLTHSNCHIRRKKKRITSSEPFLQKPPPSSIIPKMQMVVLPEVSVSTKHIIIWSLQYLENQAYIWANVLVGWDKLN